MPISQELFRRTTVHCEPCKENNVGILWTILIGFIAGLVAKFIVPGSGGPSGFVLTTILGIVGAFLATFIGQALGWYTAGEGAGLSAPSWER